SERLREPEWLRAKRLAAFRAYEEFTVPTWDRTSLAGLDLERLTIAAGGAEASLPAPLAKIEKESGSEANLLFQVDGETVLSRLSPELEKDGVIVCDFRTAIAQHEAILKEHFQSVIGFDEDKLVALHYAALSCGFLVYVPPNVTVTLP